MMSHKFDEKLTFFALCHTKMAVLLTPFISNVTRVQTPQKICVTSLLNESKGKVA